MVWWAGGMMEFCSIYIPAVLSEQISWACQIKQAIQKVQDFDIPHDDKGSHGSSNDSSYTATIWFSKYLTRTSVNADFSNKYFQSLYLHSWTRTARLTHGHRILRLAEDFEMLRLTPDFETLRPAGARNRFTDRLPILFKKMLNLNIGNFKC